MKKMLVAASNRVLGVFLPEVKAQARCPEAFTFCKCVKHHRYIWNYSCTGCTISGTC